jgi:hypothetical protein
MDARLLIARVAVAGSCLVGVLGCGDETSDDAEAGADAGTGGTDGGSGGQSDAGTAGDSAGPPPCDAILGLDNQCLDQVALPTAGAGGGPSTPSCVIQLDFEDFNPNQVNVAVDCEVTPYSGGDHDATEECWQYDDVSSPSAIVLCEALCARVTEEGFTRIDIVLGCSGPFI